MTPSLEIEPRPHWSKVSALTTASPLLCSDHKLLMVGQYFPERACIRFLCVYVFVYLLMFICLSQSIMFLTGVAGCLFYERFIGKEWSFIIITLTRQTDMPHVLYLFGYKPILPIIRDPKLLTQKINLINTNCKYIILGYKPRAIFSLEVYRRPWNFHENTKKKWQ